MEDTENIDPDECESDGHSEPSLFENMIGFEEFNPVDDSAMNTICYELQEGTLLSILNDELFVDVVPYQKSSLLDQQGECVQQTKEELDMNKFNQTSQTRNKLNTCSIMQCHEQSTQPSQNDDALHCAEQTQMGCTSYRMTCKRMKHGSCENVGVKKQLSHMVNPKQLLERIQHDHCYVGSSKSMEEEDADQKQMCSFSERSSRSASRESLGEGSNSDPGYDTMSVTTSPGTRGSSEGSNAVSPTTSPPPQVTLHVPRLPPLGEHIDPVALIDARIKVNLTEEEKETLKAEGLPIPTTLPLTKTEEKVLRTVRRKIRNKVAAQESRKRKKEHLCNLEQRIKEYSSENLKLKKRVEILQSENKKLLTQVEEFQMLLTMKSSGTRRSTQMGACLMILALCFAVIIGGTSPKELWNSQQSGYTTSSVRSRSLLSLEHQTNIQSMACHWFHHIFVSERDYPGTSYISAMCNSQHCKDVNKCHLPTFSDNSLQANSEHRI